jgi:hypothetical protein
MDRRINNFLIIENPPIIKAQADSSRDVLMLKKFEKQEDNKLTCRNHHSLK